jgi:hypothetical protein
VKRCAALTLALALLSAATPILAAGRYLLMPPNYADTSPSCHQWLDRFGYTTNAPAHTESEHHHTRDCTALFEIPNLDAPYWQWHQLNPVAFTTPAECARDRAEIVEWDMSFGRANWRGISKCVSSDEPSVAELVTRVEPAR